MTEVRHRRRQALSLLEILFTIGLLTVILVAFAAIYPSAYRLNRKSARATIAAKTCSAVAAEILALPFYPNSFTSNELTLEELSRDTGGTNEVKQFVNQKMKTSIPEGYTIRPQGVRVNLFPPVDGANLGFQQARYAKVQVTCYWTDANSPGLEKSVTIVSGKAENRDVR